MIDMSRKPPIASCNVLGMGVALEREYIDGLVRILLDPLLVASR